MADAAAVVFNPFDPGFAENPYEQYTMLREREPVHRTLIGPVLLTRYDDVLRILRDPSLSVEESNATPMTIMEFSREVAGDRSRGSRAILNLDPPDHTRLRRLVQKAFTPRMVEQLEGRVAQLVDQQLDAVAPDGCMDVISDLAFPLPFIVISEMLGMPTENRDELRGWSHTMVKTLGPFASEDDVRAALVASDAMTAYVRDAVASKRAEPADDLLSALIAAEDEGDMLDEDELIDQVMLLYIAGHETTVNLIGNGTLALLRHPEQMARLRDDPALDVNAVEELLRYDSPVQISRRIAMSDCVIDGVEIEKGTALMTGLGAANRDPEKWGPTADELDLGRSGASHHMSFGNGIHHCVGAALARLEGRIAIGSLVRRFPDLALTDEAPGWNGHIVLRGLDRLPVSL